MKRILVFIDWYKPGYKAGGPIRSMSNMVENLIDHYEFYIITRNTDYLETTAYQSVISDQWVQSGKNEWIYYISGKELSVKKIKNLVKETKFEIAYINGVYSFYFSILPLLVLKVFKKSNYIIAPRGMFSRQTFKAKVIKKRAGILFARLTGLYNKAIFHATSESEYTDLVNLKLKPLKIFPITNFPGKGIQKQEKSISKEKGKLKLVSIGRISNEKNTLFALKCLKNYSYTGQIEFDLYGAVYQPEYWQKCQEIIAEMPDNVKVTYHGNAEHEKVPDILSDHHFLFLPSLGENFGHSILESLSNARPVIISNTTPWNNLSEKQVGWDIALNEPEMFAEAIQAAIDMDEETFRNFSEKSLQFAMNCIDIQKIKSSYCEMLG